ncbi:MAG: hypothetical protein WC464_05320 [Bdellovibrionales bacterium]
MSPQSVQEDQKKRIIELEDYLFFQERNDIRAKYQEESERARNTNDCAVAAYLKSTSGCNLGVPFFLSEKQKAKAAIIEERILQDVADMKASHCWQIVASALLKHQNEVVEHFIPKLGYALNAQGFPYKAEKPHPVKNHSTLLHISLLADNMDGAGMLMLAGADFKGKYNDPRSEASPLTPEEDFQNKRDYPPISAEDFAVILHRPALRVASSDGKTPAFV